ncbi:MAG: hypothetical protein AAFU55_05790 [Pseudomonadota bacterium]
MTKARTTKAALVSLLAATDAAPRGGFAAPADAEALVWTVAGDGLKPQTAIDGFANVAVAEVNARAVHYPVLRDIAETLGKTPFAAPIGDDRFEIGLR